MRMFEGMLPQDYVPASCPYVHIGVASKGDTIFTTYVYRADHQRLLNSCCHPCIAATELAGVVHQKHAMH
jgi:hypothetical protein